MSYLITDTFITNICIKILPHEYGMKQNIDTKKSKIEYKIIFYYKIDSLVSIKRYKLIHLSIFDNKLPVMELTGAATTENEP